MTRLLGLLVFCLLAGLAACTPAATPTSTPTPPPTLGSTPTLPVVKPQLGLEVGDTAIDFRLKDLDGTEVSLYDLLADKPVMLEFGSYT